MSAHFDPHNFDPRDVANPDCEFCHGTGYDETPPTHPDDPAQHGHVLCTCVVEAIEDQERKHGESRDSDE